MADNKIELAQIAQIKQRRKSSAAQFKGGPLTSREERPDRSEKDEDGEEEIDILAMDRKKMEKETKKDHRIVKQLVDYNKSTGRTNLVLAQSFLASLQEINSATDTIKIELNLQLWWIEKSCEGIGEGGEPEEWKSKGIDFWRPIIEFVDDVDMVPVGEPSFYIRDVYSKYGVVNWYQKYKGHVRMKQNLREFPFDTQRLIIKFGALLWSDEYIHLEDITIPAACERFKNGMDLTEYTMMRTPEVKSVVEYNFEDERDISYLEIHLILRRKSHYYLTHVISLIFLCDIMLWCIFFVNPDNLQDRMSLVITLFLALVALNFAVAALLPKVSYATKLTQYFVVSYICISLSGIQCVVVYYVNKYVCQKDPGTAPCNTALYIDWGTACFLALSQFIFTLYFIYLGFRKDYHIPPVPVAPKKEEYDESEQEIDMDEEKDKNETDGKDQEKVADTDKDNDDDNVESEKKGTEKPEKVKVV